MTFKEQARKLRYHFRRIHPNSCGINVLAFDESIYITVCYHGAADIEYVMDIGSDDCGYRFRNTANGHTVTFPL